MRGECTIMPVSDDENRRDVPEIFHIQTIKSGKQSEVDVSEICESESHEKIRSLVDAYKPKKCRKIEVKMTIVLSDEEPIYQRARRLSEAEKCEVNAQIHEWIKDGIVRESHSDYASPVVLVKKKDSSSRLCVDYCLLNRKIISAIF